MKTPERLRKIAMWLEVSQSRGVIKHVSSDIETLIDAAKEIELQNELTQLLFAELEKKSNKIEALHRELNPDMYDYAKGC